MGSTPTASRLVSSLVAAVAISTGAACGGATANADTIDREVFIATYVDLRIAALDTDSQRLGDNERVDILARHGVTAEELILFADLNAPDLDYMREVWREIELSLDRPPTTN